MNKDAKNKSPKKPATKAMLKKRLQQIGRRFFISHYQQLCNKNISNEALVIQLVEEYGYSKPASITRISGARKLLDLYTIKTILTSIIESSVGNKTKIIATDLLNQHNKIPTNNKPNKVKKVATSVAQPVAKSVKNTSPTQKKSLQHLRRKSLHLLPNLFTLCGLFFGFISIVLSMQNNHMLAMYCIAFAAFFDGIDGQVARMVNSFSRLGVELDSIADMVSFGVAPAVFLLSGGLETLGNFGWAISFLYVAAAALRLARFNVTASSEHDENFMGLPSPAAAGVVVLGWVALKELPFMTDSIHLIAMASITVLVSLTMFSNLHYKSLKMLFAPLNAFFASVAIAILLSAIIALPLIIPFCILFIYWITTPIMALICYLFGNKEITTISTK